jgi:type II secretory pathway pseudopilin PulG
LIELLVVVAIISLLSSVVMAALNDARARARDARRIEDLRQINTALQLYLQDHAEAPDFGDPNDSYDHIISSAGNTSAWASFELALSPYIKKLPTDPLNGRQNKHPVGGCSTENFSTSCSYQYYYKRLDFNSQSCFGNPSYSSNCSKKNSYILDASFEKRSRGDYPVSFILGVSYPAW